MAEIDAVWSRASNFELASNFGDEFQVDLKSNLSIALDFERVAENGDTGGNSLSCTAGDLTTPPIIRRFVRDGDCNDTKRDVVGLAEILGTDSAATASTSSFGAIAFKAVVKRPSLAAAKIV